MATLTPNYNLSKPESNDKLSDFMSTYNDNMDIIDQNLGGGGGGSSTLAGLTDVVLNALQDGNFLRYDAALRKWVNADGDPVSVSDLTDVELTNLSDGQFLVYDADTQKWVNVSITIPDMSNYYNKTEVDDIIDDIRQVPDATGANIGDVLTHTASGEGWYPPAKELPVYSSGDASKVLTVDSNGTLIWASAGGGDTVTWTQIVNSGTKIATISINGVPTDVYAPNGGGTGGHVIQNESGVDMAARANLQFKGADVSDDSEHNRTVVDMSYTEISYEDWLALSQQEKETGRWDVVGVPGVEGTVSFDLMTKLWENPAPTQAITADTDITVNTAGYDLVMIICAYSTSYLQYKDSFIIPQGVGVGLCIASNRATSFVERNFDYVSDTTYRCKQAYVSGTANDAVAIPTAIYGIKLHHTVEINAIAADVSTQASKCMLSDGVTSVEDKFEEIAETPRGSKVIAEFVGDGVKTYGDALTALIPYISQADILSDSGNLFYPRNNVVYFSVNMSSSGGFILYSIRLDANNLYWKAINVKTGSETDYISTVVPSGRKIRLYKKL